MSAPINLPIEAILGDVITAVRQHGCVVIEAPPGAGKTTRVPPALLDAGLFEGQLLLLEPRRLAARTVAHRIARERHSKIGGEVGYQVRYDRRISTQTRIAVITEGILTRRMQSDPFLEGVGAVVLDEFHERSIHSDLALAFVKELREVREDLKLVVMSATLGVDEVATYLDAPIVASEGRTFPLDITHAKTPPDSLESGVVQGVEHIVSDPDDDGGDILVFLPGVREIKACRSALERRSSTDGLELCVLYGALDPEAQDRAIEPGPNRKVVLSTNIAETSLTIQNVSAVVDSGQVKQLYADRSSGFDELRTEPISLASAKQRAGRAGRLAPGRVYRLWTTAAEFAMAEYTPPSVARVDVTRAVLDVVAWSRADPSTFDWFERPPVSRVSRAVELLLDFGAIDESWNLTSRGERLLELPLHPRIGVILEEGVKRGCAATMARICGILSERDFVTRVDDNCPGARSDLTVRAEILEDVQRGSTRGARAQGFQVHVGRARGCWRAAQRLAKSVGVDPCSREDVPIEEVLKASAVGFPDRICFRRGDGWAVSGGDSVVLGYDSLVREAEAVAALQVFGKTRSGHGIIRLASEVRSGWLAELFEASLTTERVVEFNESSEQVQARRVIRFRGLTLEETPIPVEEAAAEEEVARELALAARGDLARAFGLDAAGQQFLERVRFLRRVCPDVDLFDPEFEESFEMLKNICWGKRSFRDLRSRSFVDDVCAFLLPGTRGKLEELAPSHIEVPSGRRILLDYEGDGPPVLAAKVQELFGWTQTPRVANGVAVLMSILGPNYRPVQVTEDLESFWERTYPEVRKELRARYSKHAWPVNPADATPEYK